MPTLNTFFTKLICALSGLKQVWHTQIHFKAHVIMSLLATLLGFTLSISIREWALLILVIFIVLITETVNTALETQINLISPTYHPLAKQTKDIASGAVLLSAILAISVGTLIFFPKLNLLWSSIIGH